MTEHDNEIPKDGGDEFSPNDSGANVKFIERQDYSSGL